MKKKLITLVLTAALGLFAGFTAKAATGDIYDICPCTADGVDLTSAMTDYSHPFDAGQELYFKVRLIARQGNGNRWYIKYLGFGDDMVADALYPMQIGLYVSGRIDYATLVSHYETGLFSTALIFKYVTKPGDFAMPIRLATEAGPAGDKESSNAYVFNPLRSFWDFRFDETVTDPVTGKVTGTNTVACSWCLNPSPDRMEPGVQRNSDYSLAKCGFYVKTIDFSDDDESPEYWRSIHENSTITGGGTVPKLVANAGPEREVTLYVWSEDESVFSVKTDNVVNMRVKSTGETRDVHVGKVTFAGGQLSKDFAIEGALGGSGRKAGLILSAYPQFNFSAATEQLLMDYIVVTNLCIEPLPPSVVVECDRATALANGEYTQYAAVLQVYLSQAYSNDVKVAITPEFTDASAADWKQYLRFSTTSDTIDEPNVDGSDAEIPVVTIPRDSTDKQTIYVFALRADVHTMGGAKVKFQSSIIDDAEADAAITEKGSKSINISAETTVITTPKEGTKAVSTTCNDEYPFTIAVSDTFADTHDATTGYKIFIKYRSSDTFVQLPGLYYVGDGGALYKLGVDEVTGEVVKTTEQPILKYTASGENLESQVYVVAPVNPNTGNAKKSEIVTFYADVKEARTVAVESFDEDFVEIQRSFTEGDSVGFNIQLSEKNETGSTIYAFLRPSSNAEAGMFSCASYNCIIGMDNPEGLPINNSQQGIQGIVTLLDGAAKPGLKITFEVVLSNDKNWDGVDTSRIVKGYDSNYLTITVNNEEPTITRMEMNNIKATGDGFHFNNKLPSGQTQSFVLYVKDPGTYDLTNTIKPFKVRWTAMLTDGTVYDDPIVIEGNPKENPFVYAFPAAGEWQITAEVMDKDMDDWSEITYTVYVTVLDQPAVEHAAEEMILVEKVSENPADLKKFQVGVGYWDPKYSGNLTVLVEVSETVEGKPNPGILKLDSSFALSGAAAQGLITALGNPEHVFNANADYYLVTLNKSTVSQGIAFTELDGTDNASIYGFRVTSYVINEDILPTSGARACDYYLTSKPTTVYINNLTPEFGANTTLENTNAWKVAGGSATQYPIKWQVKFDVDGDWNTVWPDRTGPGIKITFSGCQNAEEESKYITEPQSGTFIPNFGSAQGDQVVTMTIEDKDGGSKTWTYLYTVEASKFLKTYATGPSGGTTTSALSQRYYKQKNKGGLGEGHTYVAGATFSAAQNFELTWNCAKNYYMNVYAFGYKVSGDEAAPTQDNGSLDGMDIPVDTTGKQNADLSMRDYYTYAPADGKDSFFYLWILTTMDESGTPNDVVLGQTIAPETVGKPGTGRVPLPSEQTEDGGYLDTIVEAIFSKEWLVADNLGDINQDGIPDFFATAGWGDGSGSLIGATTGGELLDSDLIDIAAGNPDEDFLPGAWQTQGDAMLVNTALASYAPIGTPFNNRLEIRGFHRGLNENSIVAGDADFSDDEQNAYKAYFLAQNGREWQEADGFDLAFWSPEPRGEDGTKRMDPTMDDTDSDGLPDGWEYFFWYQGKVWAQAPNGEGNLPALGTPRAGQQYVFERFNPDDILRGTEIPADDVWHRFDPVTPIDTGVEGYTPDFDGDGLADVEELLIGTNPCHWDTDGDHMCDGWEVMMSLDPLNGARDGNSDGDFMAFCSLEGTLAYELAPGSWVFDTMGELLPYNELTGDGDYTMEPIGDGYYADKNVYDNFQGRIELTTEAQNEDGEDNYPVYQYTEFGFTYYTTDPDYPGAEPARESVPVLVHDVTLTRALLAQAKMTAEVDEDGNLVPYVYGLPGDTGGHWGRPMLTGLIPEGTVTLLEGSVLSMKEKFILIHDQVREAFGFDPRTGWYANGDGYVADRWNPLINRTLNMFDATGVAVNTAPYCDFDEYLVLRYRRDYGIHVAGEPDFSDDAWANFNNFTTKPTITYAMTDIEALVANTNEEQTVELTDGEITDLKVQANIAEYLAQAFAQSGSTKSAKMGHGADTDGDGVPDGWELYVSRSPNVGPGDEEDGEGPVRLRDYDNDSLNWAAEYAGTDSCNAYAGCPSIYDNHPGNKIGWFNKFFPTNPNDKDTDGDKILDGAEGSTWMGIFYNGNSSYSIGSMNPGMTFIYGNPVDSITTCVRGGGMNPLTVDTDKDGIPDLWEMQYAGIAVNAVTRKFVPPPNMTEQLDIPIAEATFTADGLNDPELELPAEGDIVYIAGGMDATWGGDAWTDCVDGGNSYDARLGTIRDVDFDHDGLQNYQEYLIQQVRHFRYDETTTPLMGRVGGGQFYGYVMMNQSVEAFADACRDAGYPENVVAWFTPETWISLGYFGEPKNAWDMMICCRTINPYIMLPPERTASSVPGALGTYIATDPRIADTDADGMDDYYEMFHGLNPLLGTTTPMPAVGDVIWDAYGNPVPPFMPHAYLNGWGSIPKDASSSDPILYPWLIGAVEQDPDGDGLRNDDERITANLTSPMTLHTDPTPLWFTDSSNTNSYTHQYYMITGPVGGMPFWPLVPEFEDPYSAVAPMGGGNGPSFLYSFEENEGYDTDNDWDPDGREIVKTLNNATDPLDFTDPSRRQALYLDGNKSWAMTRDSHFRGIDAVDFFKQFTVEAWVCPEKTGEQTIIDRCAAYGWDALNKDDAAIRSNFRIGLTAEGNVYGMFDNSDAIESGRREGVSCQTVTGPVLPLNKWSHVALTYDGKDLRLFVNGVERTSAATSLIPANGITGIIQDPTYTNSFIEAGYAASSAALFIGGRPVKAADGGLAALQASSIEYEMMRDDEWFQGYVDEVRIWDGARTVGEIAENYKRHMTMDDAATNRLEVYTHFMALADATRNDNDGLKNLTAELVQLYDFSTLPGAVNAADVAKTPTGFEIAVAGQTTSKSEDFRLECGWWNACETKSTVYDDYRVVPWIENTVHHLPVMDGSVVDSYLYSTYLGGYYTHANAHELQQFTFSNSAMPYQYYDYYLQRYQRLFCLNQYAKAHPDDEAIEDILLRYEFELRSDFIGTADLVPMGGAFAKTAKEMWDGNGPADAWDQTGVDTDGDGLPDWWEQKYGLDVNDPEDWSDTVTYPDANGAKMPAWEAYMRDLAKGMQPAGGVDGDYASTADADGDGLIDWWQKLYAVAGGSEDSDGDGLSNYVEYMLSEVFEMKDAAGKWLRFLPNTPYSANPNVSDYFFRIGQLYVGEVFTDHDFVRDQWESAFYVKSDFVSPYVWDALNDHDEDGWSNYSEFQYGTDPTVSGSLGIDGVEMNEYPIPTIEANIRYEGMQNTAGAPLVVKAWSDPALETIPDAVWTIGAAGVAGVLENGETNFVNGTKYIGMNPNKEMLLHLSPGSIVKGKVKFEFKDLNWILVNEQLGAFYSTDPETAVWQTFLIDRERVGELGKGDIIEQITDTVVGEIDYQTGAVTIDFTKVSPMTAIVGDITGDHEGEEWLSVYTLASSYIRVNWYAKPITAGAAVTYYLADADKRSAENNSRGHVKEGLNTFIAFYDFDGNGDYTAGEPYGCVTDVDVGWNYARLAIELTDTHPITVRVCCAVDPAANQAGGAATAAATMGTAGAAALVEEITGSTEIGMNDRDVLYGTQSGNLDASRITPGTTSGGRYERVRVVRTLVDDRDCTEFGIPARVVLDKLICVDGERYITEVDFLKSGALDIDWETLASDIAASSAANAVLSNVTYRIVLGNGTVSNSQTNNILPTVFSRFFDPLEVFQAAKPIIVGGDRVIDTPSPTFSWSIPQGLNSYTAFHLQIYDTGDNLVWDSGMQPMPPRVADKEYGWRYDWTAPICVGDVMANGTVFKNNTNYRWCVTVANARFRDIENWSQDGSFRMNLPEESLDYGTMQLAVRYYGPSAVASRSVIRVEAFSTPDFSGRPVASGYVTAKGDLASTDAITVANAKIPGLREGLYYVRAYIDTEADMKREAWESWGYHMTRDTTVGTIFTPLSVRVGPKAGASEIIPIYIEDCDTDDDSLPDAWEWSASAGLDQYNIDLINQSNPNGIALSSRLAELEHGDVQNGLAVLTRTSLTSVRTAALMLGVDATGAASKVESALASAAGEPEVNADSLVITAIDLDRAMKSVTLTIDAEVSSSLASSAASAFYVISGSDTATVTCKVWRKDTLMDANWQLVLTKPGVLIGKEQKSVKVDLGDGIEFVEGFYKVTIEQ